MAFYSISFFVNLKITMFFNLTLCHKVRKTRGILTLWHICNIFFLLTIEYLSCGIIDFVLNIAFYNAKTSFYFAFYNLVLLLLEFIVQQQYKLFFYGCIYLLKLWFLLATQTLGAFWRMETTYIHHKRNNLAPPRMILL
jgi:hypothetical protein